MEVIWKHATGRLGWVLITDPTTSKQAQNLSNRLATCDFGYLHGREVYMPIYLADFYGVEQEEIVLAGESMVSFLGETFFLRDIAIAKERLLFWTSKDTELFLAIQDFALHLAKYLDTTNISCNGRSGGLNISQIQNISRFGYPFIGPLGILPHIVLNVMTKKHKDGVLESMELEAQIEDICFVELDEKYRIKRRLLSTRVHFLKQEVAS